MEFDSELYQQVYEHALANAWKWRISGELRRPSYEDVVKLVDNMAETVNKASGSISIESGGILVKRTDDYIDVYLFAGGAK